MSKSLSEETKAFGTFLVNFLNCKSRPNNMSDLVNECLNIMKRYLGYDNPEWNNVQITSSRTFNELISLTEHGYFKALIAPLFRAHALGGFHPYKDRIFSERRNKLIRAAFRKCSDSAKYSWGEKNESTRKDFTFYIEFALLRKNTRKVVTRIIKGETLEKIQHDDFLGNFLLCLKSEYLDLNQQIIIRGNQVKIAPLMTDIPNNTYSAISFLNGYLIPCLSYCLLFSSENEKILQRIKRCQICSNFFFAKKVDKRTKYCPACSPKSKMNREERSEYQKKWRQKKKLEELAIERKTKIQNYMDKLDCSREEAEEIIKADSMM